MSVVYACLQLQEQKGTTAGCEHLMMHLEQPATIRYALPVEINRCICLRIHKPAATRTPDQVKVCLVPPWRPSNLRLADQVQGVHAALGRQRLHPSRRLTNLYCLSGLDTQQESTFPPFIKNHHAALIAVLWA
jgi:hypothetical protein